jgi:8-oxo-dGTP pyrophosphatase MutT (NUDIX family)
MPVAFVERDRRPSRAAYDDAHDDGPRAARRPGEVGVIAPTPGWLAALAARSDVADHEWFATYAPPDGEGRRSAVLMLFGPDPRGGEDVVLTERAHTLRSHPGQVSFPGGRLDPDDDGSVAAALREAEEEVGLDPAGVDVLATFPDVFLAPSQHAVTPVLAWWPSPVPVGVVDRGEVERVLRVPVNDLLAPDNRFTAVFGPYKGPAFEVGDLFVWGFTAMLLSSLFELAGTAVPWDVSRERPLPDRVMSPWMRGTRE